MPVNTESNTTGQTNAIPPRPSQAEFGERIREQALKGLRTLLEQLMQEELTALLGAKWGEHSAKGQGYRNGYYQRDLLTSTGLLEQLNVPRDREGVYQTQVFEQYQRQEPALQAAITEMYVAGTGVTKVGEVVESLTGQSLSPSAVSRITAALQTQFQKWQSRPLSRHYRIFYLARLMLKKLELAGRVSLTRCEAGA